MKKVVLILLIIAYNLSGVWVEAQSKKAQKLYDYYGNLDGNRIQTISKETISLGVNFIKNNESLLKLIADLKTVKILTIKNVESLDFLKSQIPGREMQFTIDGLDNPLVVWVKKGPFRVKEAHLILDRGKKTTIISAYGKFKIKDLKEMNQKFIQKEGIKNIPFLSKQ